MGGGGPTSTTAGTSNSTPTLYNWSTILPPWVQAGQQTTLPWLMSRASEGLLPSEESTLWGQVKDSLETSSDSASKKLMQQLSSSGLSPSSPMAAGGFTDLASDKMTQTSKAALDFAKMKIGEKDTAIGHLLTSLYTPAPAAVGNTSTSLQNQSSGGGGGK